MRNLTMLMDFYELTMANGYFVNGLKDQISYLKSEQYFFPPIFDSRKICNCLNKFDNIEKIRVLHAPTNPNVKGTPIVRAAVMNLKSKGYDFVVKLPSASLFDVLFISLNVVYSYGAVVK